MNMKAMMSRAVMSVVCLLWGGVALATDFTTLSYLTEENKPYNYSENGVVKGVGVDVLKAVWQTLGVPEQEVAVMPWARGYAKLSSEQNIVLFATVHTKARERLFKWACSFGSADISLISLASRNIVLHNVQDAKPYSITAVRTDVGESLLLNQGFDEAQIKPSNNLTQAIRLLTAGKVDLLSTNNTTAVNMMLSLGLDPGKYKKSYVLSNDEFCYAFSTDVPDALVAQFQGALTQVVKSPTFAAINAKYGVKTIE